MKSIDRDAGQEVVVQVEASCVIGNVLRDLSKMQVAAAHGLAAK